MDWTDEFWGGRSGLKMYIVLFFLLLFLAVDRIVICDTFWPFYARRNVGGPEMGTRTSNCLKEFVFAFHSATFLAFDSCCLKWFMIQSQTSFCEF